MVLRSWIAAVVISVSVCGGVFAGEADVVDVKVAREGPGVYRFDVTLSHSDTGWKHYADRWEVLDPGGTLLGKRVLGRFNFKVHQINV